MAEMVRGWTMVTLVIHLSKMLTDVSFEEGIIEAIEENIQQYLADRAEII